MKYIIYVMLTFSFMVSSIAKNTQPRVFVFTDINIDKGDPDDRQSLVHLFWYADELSVEGIVPDRWNAEGLEACYMALEAYEKDFKEYNLSNKGFPATEKLKSNIATDETHAEKLFVKAASKISSPLYVLVWGNMVNFGKILRNNPKLSHNIRLISIGTHLMIEEHRQHLPEAWTKTEKPCEQYNWNGFGRDEVYEDPRFKNMWWLEINWTYEGMFSGDEPKEMYKKLSAYGALGEHMLEITKNQAWARYFRVGDTPTVLYVIDPDNDLDDPTQAGWAGKFTKPFPDGRPNYYTDFNGPVEWDYKNPCNTWDNHRKMRDFAKSTLEEQRPEMYEALLHKLNRTYK